MKRSAGIAALLIFLLAIFAFANNTTLFSAPQPGRPLLLAHRGLAQTYGSEGLTAETCTASRIHPPAHAFIENTLDSMAAAFRNGADIVELDIHPTRDGHFAVFHDWSLDCRTDGKGVTRERTLAELKRLDVGYGYTADQGRTFPFRGKGVGLMPSLDEVLTTFPGRRFLIHVKSNDISEGYRLADFLERLPAGNVDRLAVYGGDKPVAAVRERLPTVRTAARRALKQCMLRYFAVGWSGYVPEDCSNSMVLVPYSHAHWLWGWPDRFIGRMQSASTEVFVLGPWNGEDFSNGVDTAEDFGQLPPTYTGGIWTNRIDLIGPLANRRPR